MAMTLALNRGLALSGQSLSVPNDYDARTGDLWQDTSATTPADAVGDAVARWDDISAAGNNFTQSTGANQPTVIIQPPTVRNLLVGTASLATQSVTLRPGVYTLHFIGTGSVTLSGTANEGPLAGTGASTRVSLTFTAALGSLTLTVSGTVEDAQLEAGEDVTAYQEVGTTSADITESGVTPITAVRFDESNDALSITIAGQNLLTNTLNLSAWPNQNGGVDGLGNTFRNAVVTGTTVGTLTESSDTGYQSVIPRTATYTFAAGDKIVVQCKATNVNARYLNLSVATTASNAKFAAAVFDLQAGTASATASFTGWAATADMIDLGGGEYRCVLYATVGDAHTGGRIFFATTDQATVFAGRFGLKPFAGSGRSLTFRHPKAEYGTTWTEYEDETDGTLIIAGRRGTYQEVRGGLLNAVGPITHSFSEFSTGVVKAAQGSGPERGIAGIAYFPRALSGGEASRVASSIRGAGPLLRETGQIIQNPTFDTTRDNWIDDNTPTVSVTSGVVSVTKAGATASIYARCNVVPGEPHIFTLPTIGTGGNVAVYDGDAFTSLLHTTLTSSSGQGVVIYPTLPTVRVRAFVNNTTATFDNFAMTRLHRGDHYAQWERLEWASLGDSLTAQSEWQPFVAGQYVMFHTAYGTGGSRISGSAAESFWQDARVNAIPTTARLVTVLGGTNDWVQSMALGTAGSTDTDTIIGALNVLHGKLVARCPDAQIVYVTPPYSQMLDFATRSWPDEETNTLGLKIQDYAECIADWATGNGYALADCFTGTRVNATNISLLMKADGNYIHPNASLGEMMAGVVNTTLRSLQPV